MSDDFHTSGRVRTDVRLTFTHNIVGYELHNGINTARKPHITLPHLILLVVGPRSTISLAYTVAQYGPVLYAILYAIVIILMI